MNLEELVRSAANKDNFKDLSSYVDFCREFLDFIDVRENIQARIVARNETQYQFLQFKNAEFSVTRPLNSTLFYTAREARTNLTLFLDVIADVKGNDAPATREVVNRSIYTIQQSIGAALDALPAGKSNTARKINGDLFERLIRLLLIRSGVECTSGIVKIPISVQNGDAVEKFSMSYQHDLIIKSGEFVKIIGSVKTSSKDRIDKIFVDKFLLGKLTGKDVPHVAIFLNDVQRKGKEHNFGVNATFLPGHFKGYTIKLNPLDGVYYFDIRPNMISEPILRDHIRTFDNFLFNEVWTLLDRKDALTAEVAASC
jgi:hypothetical protein